MWPRLLHYLISKGGVQLRRLEQLYNSALDWSAIGAEDESSFEEFMGLNSFTQPSGSDFVYLAHKGGVLSFVKGEVAPAQSILHGLNSKSLSATARQVARCEADGVVLKSGALLPCGVFLKCVGWEMPDVKAIMPSFASRHFIFINESPNIVFVCDPHYQVPYRPIIETA